MNEHLASRVLDQMRLAGVEEICICPGGRNAPFVEALSSADSRFKVFWFFEERSAAFFALGRTRATGKPVAVSTTSGTAAGELLPAVMEAYYSGLPLILLTADRPIRFRGSGAPQSAEQAGIFGVYAERNYDIEGDEEFVLDASGASRPWHINVCFEDPIRGGQTAGGPIGIAPDENLEGFLGKCRAPMVIVGQLEPGDRPSVETFLEALGAPVYVEGLSGLRESSGLSSVRLCNADRLVDRACKAGYCVDGVLRIGGVPTHRVWRDVEDLAGSLPVVSVSRLPFSGLGRASLLLCGDITRLLGTPLALADEQRLGVRRLLELDRAIQSNLASLLLEEPESEPGIMHAISARIDDGSVVYLGNSLPIREWDSAATRQPKGLMMHASRGLNGIDGQLSTFLGLCRPGRPHWAVLGDLTTLYDLAAPWPLSQLDSSVDATLVVINNGGGKIFERMFLAREFLNEHELSFESWALMWSLPYHLCTEARDIPPGGPGLRVVEFRPSADATTRFWNRYESLIG